MEDNVEMKDINKRKMVKKLDIIIKGIRTLK